MNDLRHHHISPKGINAMKIQKGNIMKKMVLVNDAAKAMGKSKSQVETMIKNNEIDWALENGNYVVDINSYIQGLKIINREANFEDISNLSDNFKLYLKNIPNINHTNISVNSKVYGVCTHSESTVVNQQITIYIMGCNYMNNLFFVFNSNTFGKFFGYVDLNFIINTFSAISTSLPQLCPDGKEELEKLVNYDKNINIEYDSRRYIIFDINSLYNKGIDRNMIYAFPQVITMDYIIQFKEMDFIDKDNIFYMIMDYRSTYIFIKSLNIFNEMCTKFDSQVNFYIRNLLTFRDEVIKRYKNQHSINL